MASDLDDIRSRLEGIAEELTEASMAILRDALEDGAEARPELDKKVVRARSAVEKAIHLLS